MSLSEPRQVWRSACTSAGISSPTSDASGFPLCRIVACKQSSFLTCCRTQFPPTLVKIPTEQGYFCKETAGALFSSFLALSRRLRHSGCTRVSTSSVLVLHESSVEPSSFRDGEYLGPLLRWSAVWWASSVHVYRTLELCFRICWLLVFLKYMFTLKGPLTPSGVEGEAMARLACRSSLTPRVSVVPLVPAQMRLTELPATTGGEWRRRHSLQRHKGRTWTAL